MSFSSSTAVITPCDSTNYHIERVEWGEKNHTSRVIHCLLITAAVRYLKPLFSSALMGAEMSFALWRRPNNIIHPDGGESLQLLVFLPVVARVSGEYEWELNVNETPSTSTWIVFTSTLTFGSLRSIFTVTQSLVTPRITPLFSFSLVSHEPEAFTTIFTYSATDWKVIFSLNISAEKENITVNYVIMDNIFYCC